LILSSVNRLDTDAESESIMEQVSLQGKILSSEINGLLRADDRSLRSRLGKPLILRNAAATFTAFQQPMG